MKQAVNYAGFQAGWFPLALTRLPRALAWSLAFAVIHSLWFALLRLGMTILPPIMGNPELAIRPLYRWQKLRRMAQSRDFD